MKKIILLILISLSSMLYGITVIESQSVYDGETIVGESYIGKFDSESEKQLKIQREKKYLQSKNDFKIFYDNDNKGGIVYMASYSTPIDYTVSFKGFCGDKYINVYGNYNNFDILLKYFLQKTNDYGYDFK